MYLHTASLFSFLSPLLSAQWQLLCDSLRSDALFAAALHFEAQMKMLDSAIRTKHFLNASSVVVEGRIAFSIAREKLNPRMEALLITVWSSSFILSILAWIIPVEEGDYIIRSNFTGVSDLRLQ